ncbi:MAG TPA: hypothetical protein VF376_13915, partial [Thermoanaerobaculia bacterium]
HSERRRALTRKHEFDNRGQYCDLGCGVADVCQEQTASEVKLQFTARPGGDDAQVVRGNSPRRA